MNIHPIFVHFPIALLSIWGLIEIIRPWKWFKDFNWKSSQAVLLVVGILGAFAALNTGELAEEIQGHSKLIETHSTFAGATTWLFALFFIELLIPLVSRWISKIGEDNKIVRAILVLFSWYQKIISKPWIRIILAILALVTLVITGMLGGAIVYGNTADPLTKYLLPLLGL